MAILYNPQKEGKGIAKNQKRGFFDCLSIFFNKFREIILSNMIFCLYLLPLVFISLAIAFSVFPDTNILSLQFKVQFVFQIMLIPVPFAFVGPAVCGLTRVTRDFGREEHVFIWSDFFATFKRCFWKGIGVSVLQYVFYVAAAFAMMVYWGSWLFFAVALIATLYFSLMQKYIYLMTVSLNLSIFKMYKNAFFLILVSFKKSFVAMLFIIVSAVMLLFYILSSQVATIALLFMFLMLLLLHFSMQRLFINYYCFKVILEEVVEPFYKENKQAFIAEDVKEEEKTDKYKDDSNITEKSEYVYENGKLIKREIAEQESVFEDTI